ncbi:heterokaryon incompatibility protein-domain-containing protein [Clohesyomyces aquaticus]|uniref:Heterokaryon incompatibility protein-domain-containing protein n=1 Tax=Clohesyomyces aquaticus TaxID=1231657 RepID=A0A1Y2A6T6_9PLEO|nr:heterokaryon incompatibility protein-domain-containing protein [Clohesyomyces aquaticus]
MEDTFTRLESDIRAEFCNPCYEFLTTNPIAERLRMATRLEDLPDDWSGKRSLHCTQNRPISLRREDICLFCRIVPDTWELIDVSYQIAAHQQSIHLWSISISDGIEAEPSTDEWYRFEERPSDILFYVCAYTREPTAPVVQMKPILENLWSTEQVQASRGWLENCFSNHFCPWATKARLPTRVLDVSVINSHGVSSELDKIRLHHSSVDETESYVALSYCWGGPQPLSLNARTIDDLTGGITLSCLPKTIVDAVRVTRDLGLRYLWVDSLCIMQDSTDDKTKEIRHMGNIYENAHVTIAAANAPTVEHGFLKAKLDMFFYKRWERLPFGKNGEVYIAGVGLRRYDTQLEPLAQRGWAFQEDLLSPRMLIFDTLGLRWRCTLHPEILYQGLSPYSKLDIADQAYNGMLQRMRGKPGSVATVTKSSPEWKGQLMDRWFNIVEIYSSRQLSLDSDKFPALSSIAANFSTLGGRYFAGLWGVIFHPCLLWRTDPETEHTSIWPRSKPTVSKYRAPSWSWASTNEKVDFTYRRFSAGAYVLKILSCEVTLANKESPFGEVTAATLTVAGLLLQNKDKSWLSQCPPRALPKGFYLDHRRRDDPSPNSVYFLRIWQHDRSKRDGYYGGSPSFGIILEKISKDQFVRIGFFEEISALPVGDIENTTETVLTII